MRKFIMALDQGTTSSRCILFDRSGNVVAKAQAEFEQLYPQPGWVEHRQQDIASSQLGVMTEALVLGGISIDEVAAIGITNQRETVLVWDKQTGAPVYNAIVWQCRRTADDCKLLVEQGYSDMIHDKTGLPIDGYFSATKLKWILDRVPNARKRAARGEILFGTVDTYLMWRLSKGAIHATDYSNASRTMLFNIHTLCWDDELLKLFDIPKAMLPKVCPSSCVYGETDAGLVGAAVPITGAVGDQQGALFGQLCFESGDVKNTYGTGCFLLMHTGATPVVSKRGLVTTVAATTAVGEPAYALEGSVFVGGAVVQWLRDELRMIRTSADSERYASRVPDTNGVYLVPAFVGLGAPYWDPYARGILTGLTRGVKKEHIIRAALESIAYQVFDVLHAMERDIGKSIPMLKVDGGASANNFLLQFQADVAKTCVTRPKVVETTARGAAFLAGLKVGYWKNIDELRATCEADRVFRPQMATECVDALRLGWAEAVARCRSR